MKSFLEQYLHWVSTPKNKKKLLICDYIMFLLIIFFIVLLKNTVAQELSFGIGMLCVFLSLFSYHLSILVLFFFFSFRGNRHE